MEPGTIAVLALVVVAYIIWSVKNWGGANKHVAAWAKANGYRLIKSEPARFDKGPFLHSTDRHSVYRVTVEDKGSRRTAWIRFDTGLMGTMSEKAEVRWDS